jgi:hypothetical protein
MVPVMLPVPQDIQSVVEEEITSAGGEVLDCLADSRRLFLRSVLPFADEVRPRDRVQGGVAVMAGNLDICVHPYTYREVCRNGAIMAHTIETHRIKRVESDAPAEVVEEVLSEVREVVRQCSAPEVFSEIADRLRSAAQTQADLAIHLIPLLSRLPQRHSVELISRVVDHFASEGDDSVFGLANAVTRIARDEPDPKVRWDLEELGGSVPSLLRPVPRPGDAAADLLEASL